MLYNKRIQKILLSIEAVNSVNKHLVLLLCITSLLIADLYDFQLIQISVKKIRMSDSDSMDEDEKIRNFDNEAQLIVQVSSLPAKSADRYILVYNTYKKWLTEHQNSLSSSHENNLLVYFKQLQEKLKPPTLWSIWSMLRKTLYAKDNLDIKPFQNLRYFIKNNAKNYRPRKAFTFR